MSRVKWESAWWWGASGILGLLVLVGALSSVDAASARGPEGSGGPRARILTSEDREAIAQVVGKRIQEQVGLSGSQGQA